MTSTFFYFNEIHRSLPETSCCAAEIEMDCVLPVENKVFRRLKNMAKDYAPVM